MPKLAPLPIADLHANLVRRVAAQPVAGYYAGGEPASEPTAWATLALQRAGETTAAAEGAAWLAQRQARDGSVGVTVSQDAPFWPTALAMLAWREVDPAGYTDRISRGADWALAQKPWTMERHHLFGHDTELEGWSWAPATHSWVEPTAFFSVALRKAGHAEQPRRHEAIRLMLDRLLPEGGANYGNTTVFGQLLLQHVHSSGIVAWALAGESTDDPRIDLTLDYLESSLAERTGLASLAWAARGLAAWGRRDAAAEALARSAERIEKSDSPQRIALLALAAGEVAEATS